MHERVLDMPVTTPRQAPLPRQKQADGPDLRAMRLTPTQFRVMALLARGMTAKGVAGLTGQSTQTVKNHVTAVHQTLDASTTIECFVALGWLTPPELQA